MLSDKKTDNLPENILNTLSAKILIERCDTENMLRKSDDWLFFANGKDVKMSCLTQKDLYEDAILRKSRDHKYQSKWVDKL